MKIKEPTVNWGAISRISKEFKKFVQATGELQQVISIFFKHLKIIYISIIFFISNRYF